MQKENIDRNTYYGLRKELGEFTSNSGIPIEVVYKMFEVFNSEMNNYVIEHNKKEQEFIKTKNRIIKR